MSDDDVYEWAKDICARRMAGETTTAIVVELSQSMGRPLGEVGLAAFYGQLSACPEWATSD